MVKNLVTMSLGIFLLLAMAFGSAYGQGWHPGDPHKMHFPQLPDETGWDVNATSPVFLADDWRCSQTGWVKDFHFWGSWKHGVEGKIYQFQINIHEDLPVGHPNNPNEYSMPGGILWSQEIRDFGVTAYDPPVDEGWYDPAIEEVIWNDHNAYFQYDVYLPEAIWFWQDEGIIYWLSISAILTETGPTWGWKSSIEQWNDDGTYQLPGQIPWTDLWVPGYPYTPGDWNNDGLKDAVDVTLLTDYVGTGDPDGAYEVNGFYPAGDVDGSDPCGITTSDVNALVAHIYQGGPIYHCPDYPPHPVNEVSMDLAFVITGGDDEVRGACCYDDGTGMTCEVRTESECADLNGEYKGDGTSCLGDANGNGIDDICEGWNPGDPHKMHFPQLPDPTGWDVYATEPLILADDWECSETGWVKDIHFWGSWKDDIMGDIDYFHLSIHSDWPADDPNNPYGYSVPRDELWSFDAYDFIITPYDPTVDEGWYDPEIPEALYNNHQQYFRYDVYLPESWWFPQDVGAIYWLDISAVMDPISIDAFWGWKSSYMHWNDDAVWTAPGLDWYELYEPEPALEITDHFSLAVDPDGNIHDYSGSGYNGGMWYPYMNNDPTWWNVWFYDHPFTYDRRKTITIDVYIDVFDPNYETFIEIAINWSTDLWSLNGNPPGQPRVPPLPPLTADEEHAYIQRATIDVFDPYGPVPLTPGWYNYTFVIDEYNPEWISIDIRGYNFWFAQESSISHVCEPKQSPQSLDLAFVITGDPGGTVETGACCYEDGTCVPDMTQADCESPVAATGVWQGAGSTCSGDTDGNGIDDACEGIFPTGACCYDIPGGIGDQCVVTTSVVCNSAQFNGTYMGNGVPCGGDANTNSRDDLCESGACCFDDGICQTISYLDCMNQSGDYQGANTNCLGDGNNNLIDDACESIYPVGACCVDNGVVCYTTTSAACANANGDYKGDGTQCLGDINPQNGIDDACEDQPGPPTKFWEQPPDLSQAGMDIFATLETSHPPVVLADDFNCTQTGPITEIIIWGSWLFDVTPPGGACSFPFTLSIHEDVPAIPGQMWSHPGRLLWSRTFEPGTYECDVFAPDLIEGFYDPVTGLYLPEGDHVCFMYIFQIEEEPFVQRGTAVEPIVYWLDVQADLSDFGDFYFGWKTSMQHWNDDATWVIGVDDGSIDPNTWEELRYPPQHPFEGESIDMAFAIKGLECSCEPGECDGVSPPIDILDIVRLIDYKFKGCPPEAPIGTCPPPIPYTVCSGDADCNCIVDILDIVRMIDWKFKECPPNSGNSCPAPCSCAEWINNCGYPFYK
jgi:hypothetical protein